MARFKTKLNRNQRRLLAKLQSGQLKVKFNKSKPKPAWFVIGGYDYDSPVVDTVKLFEKKSKAQQYKLRVEWDYGCAWMSLIPVEF